MCKMNIILIIAIVSCVVFSANSAETPLYRTAQTLDYNYIFNQKSDVSLVVLACGGIKKLSATLKSFFYFNTYSIHKVYIAHCSSEDILISAALPFGYQSNKHKFQIIQAKQNQNGIIGALQTIYAKINTKYIYQTDAQWANVKGFGFIEKAISILKYGSEHEIKMSQIVTNYPYWRAFARLTKLQWIDSGQAFHQIIPFNQKSYPFFSLSPSLIDFQQMFSKVIGKKISSVCQQYKCSKDKMMYDKCCLAAIGSQFYKQGYLQIYLNDGSSEPNHIFLSQ